MALPGSAKQNAGRAQDVDSTAPGDRRAMLQLLYHDCNLEWRLNYIR